MPRAAICTAIDEPVEIADIDIKDPQAGEVRVRLGASGVCHSDLSVQNGTILIPTPVVLGHEGAGVIEDVGEGVDNLHKGDHVVISWVPQCGECYFCEYDQGHLCDSGNLSMATNGLLDGTYRFERDGQGLGQMAASGTWSEETIVPAIGAVKVDADIPKQFGATDIVDASEGDPVSKVMEMTDQRGADVAFEVIGLGPTIEQTVNMTRRGGQSILVGVPKMDVMLNVPAFLGLVLQEKTIKGCWYGSSNVHNDVPKLARLYSEGQLKLDELVSREIKLDDVNDALRAMEHGEVARSVIVY